MPNYSKEWTENTLIIPENILLTFNKEDARLVRNWSKSKKDIDIFEVATEAVISLPAVSQSSSRWKLPRRQS